jgi:hypothetical protein
VPHGLRKGGSRIIVESGGTAHEVMSVLGHSSLKEAERYTKAFNRRKLAASAMEKVAKAKTASNVVALPIANR